MARMVCAGNSAQGLVTGSTGDRHVLSSNSSGVRVRIYRYLDIRLDGNVSKILFSGRLVRS